jgi:hypothetical protein
VGLGKPVGQPVERRLQLSQTIELALLHWVRIGVGDKVP